jgi:hypothetical protein
VFVYLRLLGPRRQEWGGVSAHRWGWQYFARLPQWLLPSPPNLGDPRATQECCRAPYDLCVVCFSVMELRQRLSLFVGFVSP